MSHFYYKNIRSDFPDFFAINHVEVIFALLFNINKITSAKDKHRIKADSECLQYFSKVGFKQKKIRMYDK